MDYHRATTDANAINVPTADLNFQSIFLHDIEFTPHNNCNE